jgi:hypothetical protein
VLHLTDLKGFFQMMEAMLVVPLTQKWRDWYRTTSLIEWCISSTTTKIPSLGSFFQ